MSINIPFVGEVATPEDVKAIEKKLYKYYKVEDADAVVQQFSEDLSSQKKGHATNKKDIKELKQATDELSKIVDKYTKDLESFKKKAEAGLLKISSAEFAAEIKAVFDGQMERFRKSGKETLKAFEQAEITKRELQESLKFTTELVDSKKEEFLAHLDISWRKIVSDLENKGEENKKLSDEIHQAAEGMLSKFEDAKLGILSASSAEISSIKGLVNDVNFKLEEKLTDACSYLKNMFDGYQAMAEQHKQRLDASDLIAAEVLDLRKLLPERDKAIIRQQEQLTRLTVELIEVRSQLNSKQMLVENCVPKSAHLGERLRWFFWGTKMNSQRTQSDIG
jgi:hypothetical protein